MEQATPGDRQPGAPFTVAEVLRLDALAEAEVVAGRDGLSRVVTGVNIIEVPDVWQWLQGGEFLLSAGYPWRDNPEQLVQLLIKLDAVGISAIGFKLGHYVESLPREVLETADGLGMPTILLPATIAYRDVFEPLYARLLDRSVAAREPVRGVDPALLRFGLDDQSIEKVALALADQVGKHVRVVDQLDNVVYFAPPDGVVLRQDVDRLDAATRSLLDSLDKHNLRRHVTLVDEGGVAVLAGALVIGRRRHGYILVLDCDAPDDEARLGGAVAHAAELVSFLLLKHLALLEGRRQACSLFFESLMSDTLTNEEATERALTLGLRLSRPSNVLMAGFLAGLELSTDEWNTVGHHIDRSLGTLPRLVTVDLHRQTLEVLVQAPDEIEPLLRSLAQELSVGGGRTGRPIVAAGTARRGLDGVRRSRSEALIAYETAQRLERGGVIQFSDLGVERVLSQIPVTPLSVGYVESLLGPVEGDDELLRTLELYLQHGGNKTATAAAVPLHRSSLRYRLGKIAGLLSANLDDPDQCHELWLALRLRRILQGQVPS